MSIGIWVDNSDGDIPLLVSDVDRLGATSSPDTRARKNRSTCSLSNVRDKTTRGPDITHTGGLEGLITYPVFVSCRHITSSLFVRAQAAVQL